MKKGLGGLRVLGIDPGLKGAFVLTDGDKFIENFAMPVGKDGRVSFDGIMEILGNILNDVPVFLERAKPMAMGSKYAFNYGRDFEKVVIALLGWGIPATLVEPSAWAKEMHEGIEKDLKPKAKSLLAVEKLYPRLVGRLPKRPKGALEDGPVDALLIAGYGLRLLNFDYDFR